MKPNEIEANIKKLEEKIINLEGKIDSLQKSIEAMDDLLYTYNKNFFELKKKVEIGTFPEENKIFSQSKIKDSEGAPPNLDIADIGEDAADDSYEKYSLEQEAEQILGEDINAKKRKNTKILVVDDDMFILLLIKKILTSVGYKVEVAESPGTGLLIYRRFKPDLVIVDVNMPKMDGFEFCAKLKGKTIDDLKESLRPSSALGSKTGPLEKTQKEQEPQIVFLTGSTEPEDIKKAVSFQAADYIVKPIKKEILLKKIDKIAFKIKDPSAED